MDNRRLNTLIVLDLDGLLVQRTYLGSSSPRESNSPRKDQDVFVVGKLQVQIRPGAKIFIQKVMENFHVAFYSSITYQNMSKIIDQLLSFEQKKQLEFIWDRAQCDLDPDFGKDPSIKEHDTVKRIDRIVNNAAVNRERRWTPENILMIDDSPGKMKMNPSGTYHLVETYQSGVDNSPTALERLWEFLVEKYQIKDIVDILSQLQLNTT